MFGRTCAGVLLAVALTACADSPSAPTAIGHTPKPPSFDVVPGTTVTFNYTGAAQSWTVPAGVTSVEVLAYGAQGGGNAWAAGGLGGSAAATIPVTPGETLYLYVGGSGILGGFNGGGSCSGGTICGGGGASDVRRGGAELSNRVVVAGGGGGSAESENPLFVGGAGGGLVGTAGAQGGPFDEGLGGEGGTQLAGGAGGLGGYDHGSAGVPGLGGAGGTDLSSRWGGGGGGGYYGGGGGAASSLSSTPGGGGGGSGFGPAGTVFGTGVWAAYGLVTLTYVVPVVQALQSITFGALSNKLYGAAAFGVSAIATSTLTVSFASLTTLVCKVSGTTVTVNAAGVCTIEATQAGNGNWQAATPVDRSFNVVYGVSLAPPAKITFKSGASIPVKFQLTGANGNAIPASLAAGLGCAVKVTFSGESPVCTSYDPVANSFQANIKTSKSLAAGSYPIVISLTVGANTFMLANFSAVAK